MKDYFDKAIEFDNLYKGLKKSCRNVRWKDSVLRYEANGLNNTYLLRKSLLDGTYKIKDYQVFKIREPKEREIVATRLPDRQVQRAICDAGLYDDITEHFIYDNCACQKGKGTTFAFDRLKTHLHKYYRKHDNDGWVLKCDVRHFFPTTQHSVAKEAVRQRIEDERAREYAVDVIDSFDGDCGIGLGSQISQLVELAVLDGLDHYIKERLHIKHYVRYMDDFVLIHEDKEHLRFCRKEIEMYLSNIGLELNKKTSLYPLKQGIMFMHWKFVLTDSGKVLMLMEKKKVYKQRRKLRRIYKREAEHTLPQGASEASYNSMLANDKLGNTYKIRQKLTEEYLSLGEEKHE